MPFLIISDFVRLIKGVCILYVPLFSTPSFVARLASFSNSEMNSGLQSG